LQKRVDAIIMAAGLGERFGQRKQFLDFGDTTVLGWSVRLFKNIEKINNVIVVFPPDMEAEEVRRRGRLDNDVFLIKGGVEREHSVMNGLNAVESEYVLIHDAVRPACTTQLVGRVIESVCQYGAAVPGIKPVSTVKLEESGKFQAIDRNRVFLIQTPQGFKTSIIKNAYENKKSTNSTDSSSVAEEAGIDVKIVEGEKENIKITVPQDYKYLKYITGVEKCEQA
jgi:2-C-methyl-D-erythritol 4-phosphate cytidylyltransferase